MKLKLITRFFVALIPLIAWTISAAPFDYLTWPDGRRVLVVQPNQQIDLSSLKSGIKGHVTDSRFRTNEAMYLANEIYFSGTEFFLRASERKLPIAHDRQFSFITNVEAYWYSRYNLLSLSTHSRAGIGLIHGPYLDLIAKEATDLNRFGRARGELASSNKDVLLVKVIDSFLSLTGMPQKFDNAVPLMLEFKSADPHFTTKIDTEIDSTGRAHYMNDFYTLKWSHDHMDKMIDMGGVAQAMLKKVLWAKFFLRRNHMDEDFPGKVFIGNNAEDGFRGAMLTLQAVSTMLLTKAALFCDPSSNDFRLSLALNSPSLTGIDPTTYKPADGLRYLPHEIRPVLIYMGDLPARQYDFTVKDSSSRLWDVASWLWAASEFFDYSNPRHRDNWDQAFGYQTPYDRSIMEQKYALLAQGLANTVFANLEAMHLVDGVLVSTWTPEAGPGSTVAVSDLSLAIVALSNYTKMLDLEPERQRRAKELIRRQADFLVRVASEDGSYFQRYNVKAGSFEGKRDMTSQAFAIQALLAAYNITDDKSYLKAAQKTSRIWNSEFWDSNAWLYRNEPGVDRVVYTPIDVGAALAALREMILVDRDIELIERFKMFFVQSIDVSGMMQSEDVYTGEQLEKVLAGNPDSDSDGIPFLGGGHGRHGIDSVFASRVEFDLSKFEKHPAVLKSAMSVPTTGEKIFDANCAVCHGPGGVGNEGPRLIGNQFVQLTGKEGVIQTVTTGRVSVGMPSWGGILTKDEIERVVDYIRALPIPEEDKKEDK